MTNEYLTDKIPNAREARHYYKRWNELQDALAEQKVDYKFSKYMGESDKVTVIEEQIKKLQSVEEQVEADMLELFENLNNVNFLTREELILLPVKFLDALGVTVSGDGVQDEDDALEDSVEAEIAEDKEEE